MVKDLCVPRPIPAVRTNVEDPLWLKACGLVSFHPLEWTPAQRRTLEGGTRRRSWIAILDVVVPSCFQDDEGQKREQTTQHQEEDTAGATIDELAGWCSVGTPHAAAASQHLGLHLILTRLAWT